MELLLPARKSREQLGCAALEFFVFGTVYNLSHPVPDSWWQGFWRFYVLAQLGIGVLVMIWMGAGGLRDMRRMLRQLGVDRRDETDDGDIR